MESATRPRQVSLPPAYSANDTSVPYLDASNGDIYLTLPYYAALPAFDAPPNYSRRLRLLIESRRKPTYLSLVIPVEKQKGIEQIFCDDGSSTASSSSSSTTGEFDLDEEKNVALLGGLQYEDVEDYNTTTYKPSRRSRSKKSQRYRRRLSIRDDAEISWASFAAMASVVLMLLCSCGIFIAWSTGLFQGAQGMGMMQAQMHGMDNSKGAGAWIGEAAVQMAKPKAAAATYVSTAEATGSQEAENVEKEANTVLTRREQIQKRAERRRRATRV